MTGVLPIDLLLLGACVGLPGVLTAITVLDEPFGAMAVVTGLTLGLFTVPLTAFGLAMLFGTHLSVPLLMLAASLLAAYPGFLWWRKRGQAGGA